MLPISKHEKNKIFKKLSKADKQIDSREKFLFECSLFQKKNKEKIEYKIWYIRLYENFLLIYKVKFAKDLF